MKKIVTMCLATAFVLTAAPIFAADLSNPCVRPENTNDPNATRNYEACMAEYNRSLSLTGRDREMAVERARSIMNNATEHLER